MHPGTVCPGTAPGAGAQQRALVAAAVSGVLVGAGIVATRYVIDQTQPGSLALLRYAIGLACLAPIALRPPRVRIVRRDLLPIALLGVGQFGVLIALLNFGLQTIPSALGALIFATFPLLTMLLAAGLRVEPLTVARSAGVVLTIVGVALALAEGLTLPGAGAARGSGSADASEALLGAGAIFASALTGAVCSVLYRPYLRRYPTVQVSAVAMCAAVLALAGLAAAEGFFGGWPRFTPLGWGAVAFIGMSSGVGYYLWLWALGHATPTRVTVFLALSPVTATLLGVVLLGEPVSWGVLAGLAAVAAGLWLAHREPARVAPRLG